MPHKRTIKRWLSDNLETSKNNENGIADQRKLHGPEGARTTQRLRCAASKIGATRGGPEPPTVGPVMSVTAAARVETG